MLGIFWDGEEIDGFTVYGYWRDNESSRPELDLTDGMHQKTSRIHGAGWTIGIWDLKVERWPTSDSWGQSIRAMLSQLIENGAVVAWCGTEGMFVEPPELFSPGEISGGVWAAATKSKVWGPPELEDAFEPLSDEQLVELQQLVGPK